MARKFRQRILLEKTYSDGRKKIIHFFTRKRKKKIAQKSKNT